LSVCLVTGAAGLIGSEAVAFFAERGMDVVGVDNDMRRYFFGREASTEWNRRRLERDVPGYTHHDVDVRDREKLRALFEHYGRELSLIIHTAAQPSHDWAAREPHTDFSINAVGTLNLLDLAVAYCPDARFIFTSSNKVYGDRPNQLPLVELETRFEIDASDAGRPYRDGIGEDMSIDQCTHSVFGASKVAADVLVQEYGRYFGLYTVCFRGGCLTGPNHSGSQLHGFLSYLMRCVATGTPYSIFGYRGKQVRDNIHSSDLTAAFWEFYRDPDRGAVYNIGGGRESHCSMLEAIEICQEITGRELDSSYVEEPRVGDHIWYISDLSRFKRRYPDWSIRYDVRRILEEIHAHCAERWGAHPHPARAVDRKA
jgi:CDP-paratose 2-epimerase